MFYLSIDCFSNNVAIRLNCEQAVKFPLENFICITYTTGGQCLSTFLTPNRKTVQLLRFYGELIGHVCFQSFILVEQSKEEYHWY